MSYKADAKIDLVAKAGNNYYISSQHRRKGNPKKSRWTITYDEEVDCFIQSMIKEWKDEKKAWGLKASNKVIDIVGMNDDNDSLMLAKFIVGPGRDTWHGYPADYVNRAQDRPTNTILKMWVDDGYITKAKMTKINRGISCDL